MKKTRKRRPKEHPTLNRERCANPWNGECRDTDIELYIFYQGNRLPICRSCWSQIADRDLDWGEAHGV